MDDERMLSGIDKLMIMKNIKHTIGIFIQLSHT